MSKWDGVKYFFSRVSGLLSSSSHADSGHLNSGSQPAAVHSLATKFGRYTFTAEGRGEEGKKERGEERMHYQEPPLLFCEND